MQIIVNGEAKKLTVGTSVASLIESFGLMPQKLAVERNLEIVPKSAYETLLLEEGDRVEIVHFIGGG